MISSMKQWKTVDEDAQTIKRENLHYFTINANRILYAIFELNGFYIGSGSVENACKSCQGRLKDAGMRWKRHRIEAIAHLLNKRASNILEAA